MTLRNVILAAAIFGSTALYAQSPEYRLTLESKPQLASSVAAALSDFKSADMSFAEVSFNKDNGGFVGIDGSSDCWTAGAGAESYTRISDRIVFFGRLSYSYFKGQHMTGSALRDMYYNPVAFLEETGEYSGVKTRELYSMTGEMSYSFSEKWSGGLSLDYESGNNVKTKDPRYRSEWSSIDVAASTWFRMSGRYALGAAIRYRNTHEIVKSHIYGITGQQYFLAIDRGGFFGTLEAVDGTYGIVSPSTFQPMTNHFIGGSVMEVAGIYHGELEVLYRKGKYGLDTSSSPKYFDFGGLVVNYSNGVVIDKGSSLHDIHFNAGFNLLNNTEYSVKYSTAQGGNTVVSYTGTKDVLSRKDINASLGYKGNTGIRDGRPSSDFGFDATMDMRLQRTTMYPYYRDHNRTSIAAKAYYDRNITLRKGMFSIGADLISGAGTGVAAEDGTYATSTGTTVKSFDNLLNRQFEYETAPYAGAGLRISYSRQLKKNMEANIKLSDSFTSLIREPAFLDGRTRNAVLISIGLNL